MSEQHVSKGSADQEAIPVVPDFEMIRPIGRGGFGRVWLAVNATTRQIRAIKVVTLAYSGNADPAGREISSLTRLEANIQCRHPNLLTIYHVGKTAEHLFYVMDPADDISGEAASNQSDYRPATLQLRLQGGPMTSEIALDYSRQLLSGLASLHKAGMVHRDVKPANCLFVGGRLKLADFGLLTEAHPLVSRVGTQKYMPPDGRMDMRADVYAAGLVIYEMLSGLPVEHFPHLGRRAAQLGTDPILTQLLQIVLKACEREPQLRFADAQAMLLALDTPPRPKKPIARRRFVTVGALAFAAATVLAAWALMPRGVTVSFITEPYEASVFVDDEPLVDAYGNVYKTPCTINGLTPGEHRVAFENEGKAPWDAGTFDFTRIRQIVSRRPW